MIDLTNLWKITTLAFADSINPCALAILTTILVTVLIKNSGKKRKVLYTGLAFIASVSLLLPGFIIAKTCFDYICRRLTEYTHYHKYHLKRHVERTYI